MCVCVASDQSGTDGEPRDSLDLPVNPEVISVSLIILPQLKSASFSLKVSQRKGVVGNKERKKT